jgi:dihydroorotate dehydrogenase
MYKLIKPAIFKMDPEKAHDIALYAGKKLSGPFSGKMLDHLYGFDDQILHIDVFGTDYANPVGLAAGFDKNGYLVDMLPHLGFGYVEIGSVTTGGGDGNEKPRLFRLPKDRAIINRMGLNNEGADAVFERLNNREFKIPIGMNITKTNDSDIMGDAAIYDFCHSFRILHPIGNYTVLNISCPNTPEGRTFEDPSAFKELLPELMKIKSSSQYKPVLVKISPDIGYDDLDAIMQISEDHGIDGYVMCNTSSSREGLRTDQKIIDEIGRGGLSGPPIRKRSLELTRHVYQHFDKPFIIGVGGISSAEDAYESIRAGASLVQVFSGLVYHGPGLPKRINKGLAKLLIQDGLSSVSDAIGVGVN